MGHLARRVCRISQDIRLNGLVSWTDRARVVGIALLGLVMLALAMEQPAPAALAYPVANPSSVTIAGSFQAMLGCSSDWQPDCATTHLSYDAGDDVWQQAWVLPEGSYDYKAALNNSWGENYGLHAQPNGANIPLSISSPGTIKFYYDHKTHWATDNVNSVIATVPGDFQTSLGCGGDWDPGCLRSWLQDPAGTGTYSFETTALLRGSYQGKVAIGESWTENYGMGGVPGGINIPFTVPFDHARTVFRYNPTTHVLTVVSNRYTYLPMVKR